MIRLAMLISGSGSTVQSVLAACADGVLKGITPVVVVSSRADAAGLAKAQAFGVATAVVEPKMYPSSAAFGRALLTVLQKAKADVVSQNGWLPLTPGEVIAAYNGKIINQHPGPLDPGRVDFGGKGMYGKRVTSARIAYAWMAESDYWTEATTHHVTQKYDEGTVIRVEKLRFPARRVSLDQLKKRPQELVDATNTLAEMLLPLEHKNVIATLGKYVATGRFGQVNRRKVLVGPKKEHLVEQAKTFAISLFPHG